METITNMLKAAAWERAKGELRALAAMQGSYPSTEGRGDKWETVHDAVETFIDNFESEALQE